ncbi:ABC transporter ATP-binding protein [Oscillospiraceae bacterium OttesenSCG-928-G22]|nr:ABC transporter ATP-binding protein [Oscillospiraceae bacterium OttesenSCG-928-G22]
MIRAENVTKKYGKFLANDRISFAVQPGETAVLLGPNGAGKSTIIKSICGLLRFEGDITIDGLDNRDKRAKAVVGYVPEAPAMFGLLTVEEHLQFIARAYSLSDGWKEDAEKLLVRFQLDDKRKKLGSELSKGMQQKVSLCCALLPRPKAVIFDEPLVGLDPHAIRELRTVIRELKDGGAALLISTHMIDSVEETWDVTHIMKDGRIVISRRRADEAGESLEDLFFRITEGGEGDA